MAEERPTPRPVQVFLDTKRFIDLEEPREFGGGNRDFFKDNDPGFAIQKKKVRDRLQNICRAIRTRGEPASFMRVQMREDALGKSYRPIGSLFTEGHGFALVGAGRIGEMIFQATPEALERLDRIIEDKAELTPRRVINKKTGEIELRVSGYRSEVGALADIVLHDGADRVAFSVDEAVAWLKQTNIIGGYMIELFRPNLQAAPQAIATLVERLRSALSTLPSGIRVRPFLPSEATARFGEPPLALSVQLLRDPAYKDIELPFLSEGTAVDLREGRPMLGRAAERDLTPQHHQALLNLLAEQTLVRSVDLPPLVEAAPAAVATGVARPTVSPPAPNGRYPVVGIIDGGIADIGELTAWRAGDARLVPAADRDENHGTFIAGLVVAGSALNSHLAGRLEPQGCMFYDLDIFPRRELRQQYFGGDIDYFFDLLDEKIKVAKRDHKVRIFNLSFGLRIPGARFGYTPLADRLDRMARANDVILVVSAGNLAQGDARPAWSSNPNEVVTMLATFGAGSQKITPPAEHLLGLTIGAINPPNVKGHEPDLPTTYTRRGPGIGGARKPDLAHYGGAEASSSSGNRTGLASLAPNGETVENCGTSFSAPNAAATLAVLDHQLEHSQPREILLALPVHKAERGKALSHATLRHISREFVGFGRPPTSSVLLVDDPYAISLVFSESSASASKAGVSICVAGRPCWERRVMPRSRGFNTCLHAAY